MATETLIKLKRGTQSQIIAGSMSEGEPAVAVDTKELYFYAGSEKVLAGRVQKGTLSERPSPGISGRQYYATDIKRLYVDLVTYWADVGAGALSELEDVDILYPQVSQFLAYDGSKWRPAIFQTTGILNLTFDPYAMIYTLSAEQRWLEWEVTSSNVNAKAFKGYLVDTAYEEVTVTLPANPEVGDQIGICDLSGTTGTNHIIIERNGNKIFGKEENLIVNQDRAGFTLVFSGNEQGWVIVTEISSGSPTPGASYLRDLLDVSVPYPQTAQVLTFNGAEWIGASFTSSDNLTITFNPETGTYHFEVADTSVEAGDGLQKYGNVISVKPYAIVDTGKAPVNATEDGSFVELDNDSLKYEDNKLQVEHVDGGSF